MRPLVRASRGAAADWLLLMCLACFLLPPCFHGPSALPLPLLCPHPRCLLPLGPPPRSTLGSSEGVHGSAHAARIDTAAAPMASLVICGVLTRTSPSPSSWSVRCTRRLGYSAQITIVWPSVRALSGPARDAIPPPPVGPPMSMHPCSARPLHGRAPGKGRRRRIIRTCADSRMMIPPPSCREQEAMQIEE